MAHRRELFFLLTLVACGAPGPDDQVNWSSALGTGGFPNAFGGYGGDAQATQGTGGDTLGPGTGGAGGDSVDAGQGGMDPVGAGPTGQGQGQGGVAGPGPTGAGGVTAGPGPIGAGGMTAGPGPVGAGGDPGAGAGPGMGAGGSTIASTTGPCLTVSFNLSDDGGQFGPRNIGAIWVANPDGSYLRTLYVWANTRKKYLHQWLAASGGDKVDAVSSATLKSLGARSATWDCTDKSGNVVPAGTYVIHAEMTEADAAGPNTSMTANMVPGMPFDLQLGNDQNFGARHLVHPQ